MNLADENSGLGSDITNAAAMYRHAGIAVCRIRPGEKRPTDRGWSVRSAEPRDFRPGDGLGLVCGWLSNGGQPGRFLVCVDLDARDAIEKADRFLPPTGAIEGRDGKPRSHWWYYVTDVPQEHTSEAEQAAGAAAAGGVAAGPRKRALRRADATTGKGETVIDFQGTGGQAVVPPSVHEGSGEPRRWEPGCSINGAPTIPFLVLWDAVTRLAEACGAGPGRSKPAKGRVPKKKEAKPVPDTTAPESASAAATPAGPVQGTGTRECDVAMAERVEQCGRYLRKTDLARSGHAGHDTTYRMARLITNDFAVTDREQAVALMQSYNDRLRMGDQQQWTESELQHKIDSALAAPPDAEYPFGAKLRTADDARAWNDPARLAERFLKNHTVRLLKNTAFEYRAGTYRVVSGEWLAAQVRGFIESEAQSEYDRRNRAREARRKELESVLSEPAPKPDALTGSHTLHRARQQEAQAELTRLSRSGPGAVEKVTQAMVTNTLSAIAVRAQLPDDTELDSWLDGRPTPPVLAVGDGLLDPVGRVWHPHDPEWFATAKLPVAYDPDAPKPAKWLAVLDELLQGDAERIAVVQELFGACLDRGLGLKWFGAFVGSGDNGKSVVLAVLRSLLGVANCSSVNLDELSTNRFAAFSLFGKLANVVGDQGHFESADEGRLKTLTGGDLVTFEQKGRDPFAAVNRAKLVFGCNTMPTFSDKSEAVWNRLVAVPFGYTVPREKRNAAFLTPEHWAAELPGILNWALDGLARLRSHGGFSACAGCEALKNQTRLDSNPARQFVTEHYAYTGDEADKIPVGQLYESYKAWCESSGYKRPLVKTRFGKEVRAAFPNLSESQVVRQGDTTARLWLGLRLVTAVTDATPTGSFL